MMNDKERNELNRYLHEQVLGRCWHEIEKSYTVPDHFPIRKCVKCGKHNFTVELPDGGPSYTTDLNAVRKVELAVIEKVGLQKYGEALFETMGTKTSQLAEIAIMTADQRARACRLAWEGE